MTSVLQKKKGYALLTVSLAATAFVFLQLGEIQSISKYLPLGGNEIDVSIVGGTVTQSTVEPTIAVPPTRHRFRDSLDNDTHYITSWTDAGFTNEFITYVNMIYLGVISHRVPILPPFAPGHHIDTAAGVLPFSHVFDIEPLRTALNITVLEWSDIKNPSPEAADPEPLGCWSSWATGNLAEHRPRYPQVLIDHLRLDISYTPTPYNTRRLAHLGKEGEWDWQLLFWPLAALISPEMSSKSKLPDGLPPPIPSPGGVLNPPDTQLACFDNLYFITTSQIDFEWEQEWDPVWRMVGRHIRFAEPIKEIAETFLRKVFDVPGGDKVPPFIAVHVRHGDFEGQCWAAERKEDCFAPLSVYARRVQEVQDELLRTKGLVVPDDRVILTSDELDPEFWTSVTAQGWKYISHAAEGTQEKYGEWYVIVIDVVMQGLGAGFVGTHPSTVSVVSAKRVGDWYGGVRRMVRFGKLGADDH